MRIFVLFVLTQSVTDGLFFRQKCDSPFPSSLNKIWLKNVWSGLFKCIYDPDEDPSLVSKVGIFVKFFYITNGQNGTYQEVSVLNMNHVINANFSNYIILHGFTDGVKVGGCILIPNKCILTKL